MNLPCLSCFVVYNRYIADIMVVMWMTLLCRATRAHQHGHNLNQVAVKDSDLMNTMGWKEAHTTLVNSIGYRECCNSYASAVTSESTECEHVWSQILLILMTHMTQFIVHSVRHIICTLASQSWYNVDATNTCVLCMSAVSLFVRYCRVLDTYHISSTPNTGEQAVYVLDVWLL